MSRRWVLVIAGLAGVLALSIALRDTSDSASAKADSITIQAEHPGEASEQEGEAGEVEAGPEDPAVYLALRESSGKELTTHMFRRAKEQAAAVSASEGSWTDIGPTNIGGRITDLVVDTSQPDTIFVAAAGGGIWKSTDKGMTYTPSWPPQSVQAIGALARGSNGTLWAGTGEANPPGGGLTYFGDGIYSSTDGGVTWQKRGLADSGSFGRIAVDPTDPGTIFAAAAGTVSTSVSQRGIYRSTDGGDTWEQVLEPPNDTTGGADLAIDPSNPDRIFATLWDHHRNNGARTYGGVGSGLYRSLDGGNTWTRLQNIVGALPTYDATGTGLTESTSLGRIGVAIAPSDSTRVYVSSGNQSGDDKGFFVSNDGGNMFTTGGRAGANSRFEWWFGRLWVDPLNKDHVFKAEVSLRVSSNGGANWSSIGQVHADQHAMEWDLTVPNRVYLGNDGGVYRSDNNGGTTTGSWIHATYEPWNQGYHVSVAADDPDRPVLGMQDNGSHRTWTNASSDPSAPFTFNSYSGGDGHYVQVDQTDHNVYYGCSQGGSCSRRIDTATTSTNTSLNAGRHGGRWTTDAPLVIDPNDPLVVYLGGRVLDRSTARGTGWVQISPSEPNDLPGPIPPEEEDQGLYAGLYGAITAIGLAKDPLPGSTPPNDFAQTIFVGTDTGLVWKTSDAGATWTKLTDNGLPIRWVNGIAVDPADKNHVLVIFSGYREGDNAANIWETSDGGATWTNVSGNLPNAPLDGVVLDPSDGVVIVSGDLGVYFLRRPLDRPDSTTWIRLGTNLPNTSIQDIKIQASTHTAYAMTFGRGIQTIPLPPQFPFSGFSPPVDNPPAMNAANAPQTIPVKFRIGGDYGLDVLADGQPQSTQINCTTLAPIGGPTPTTGTLSFSSGQYTYAWKTQKPWSGTCRQFSLKLDDDTTHVANFRFR